MSWKPLVLPVVAAVLVAAFQAPRLRSGPQDPLAAADKAFADRTYLAALEAYRALEKDPRYASRRDHVVVRIGLSLARLNRGDEARDVLGAYAAERKGTESARAALVERGVVTLTMPHYYCQKGDERRRGEWIQGGEYHWTEREDLLDATADLEAARLLGKSLRATPAWDDAAAASHARGLLELAAGLERLAESQVPWVAERRDAADAPYGALETWRDRMFAAFDEAIATQEARRNAEAVATALYLKGSAARRALETRRWGDAGLETREPGATAFVPVPEGRDPIKIMAAARARARGLPAEDAFLFGLAWTRLELDAFVDAVADLRELLRVFPKSLFAGDAKAAIERTTFTRLDVADLPSVAPGEPAAFAIDVRNAAEVRVEIYRFDGAKLWLGDGFLDDEDLAFDSLEDALKESGWRPRDAERVYEAALPTGDDGKHRVLRVETKLPGRAAGTYVVRTSGGGVVRAQLLNVTDLALVLTTDDARSIAYVADAVTGRPAAGADVVIRERWTTRGFFGGTRWVERHVRGVADADGLFVRSHEKRSDGGSSIVEAVAVDGPRLALAPSIYVWRRDPERPTPAVFAVTDRPVYRPGDVVKAAAVATFDGGAGRAPMKDAVLRVVVTDPLGAKLFDRELKTDADGACELDLGLGKAAALGVYSVAYSDGRRSLRGTSFRVEEYLKPEFQVAITAGAGAVRLGEKAKAVVRADYYFGGGVAGGTVAWKVLREPWRPVFRRDEPWRSFYGPEPSDEGPASWSAGRTLVASGSGALDSTGAYEVVFDTAPFKDEEGDGSVFVVQAEVVDASRRTISAEEAIVVAKRALAVDVRLRRGFLSVGETAEFELQATTTNGAPAAVAGEAVVASVRTLPGAKPGTIVEERVEASRHVAATDAQGIGFFRTTFDVPGRYAVRFEARDAFEQPCVDEVVFWVRGPEFRADGFEMKNLELVAERRTWRKGETALVLVNANLPDAAVLFTVVAGPKILVARVLRLAGKTALLEIPILEEHAPNIHLRATTVRGGGFYEETLELFVPPVDKFLNVGLAFGKAEYRPGAPAELIVTTTDASGAPVAARAFAAVVDASLFYIQHDATPDVRRFFYGDRRSLGATRRPSNEHRFGVVALADVSYGDYETVGEAAAWRLQLGRASELLAGAALTTDGFLGWSAGDGGRTGGLGKRGFGLAARDGAAPAATAAAPREEREAAGAKGEDDATKVLRDFDGEDKSEAPVALRTDLRDAAFWSASVRTDATGKAVLRFPFPESTTRWRAKAWTWDGALRVGEATADARTTKDLVVRLRAPRFFVEGDLATVSAIVDRRAGAGGATRVAVDLGGDGVLATDDPLERVVEVAAGTSARVDWRVRVLKAGAPTLAVTARAADDSDGVARPVPSFAWGAEVRTFAGAVLDGDAARTLVFEIPEDRRPEASEIRVVVRPSLALTLVDALPYLIEYPYGCLEQTVSRFVPAVVVARVLKEAGTTLAEVAKKRADLPKAAEQGAGRERFAADFALDDVVKAGLDRLAALRHADGGFGWWQGDDSDVFMTSYALQGLLVARAADVRGADALIPGAVAFLSGAIGKERRLETAAFAACVLAKAGAPASDVAAKLFEARERLSLYGRALLASALKAGGRDAEARLVVKAFDDGARKDAENGTVHWGSNEGGWWMWWNSRLEANVAILHALLDVDPSNAHVAPLAKWIALNRRGSRWSNTRDTAHAIFALVRYARAAGELDPDLEVEVDVAGAARRTLRFARASLLAGEEAIVLAGAAVPAGRAEVTVRTRGRGRCYVAAEARVFSREAEIKAAGRELLVEREYAKVIATSSTRVVDGREETIVDERFEPLAAGATLASGDVVEVRLKVDAKNDYEHLLFEDLKPAGFEPLEVRSGGRFADGIRAHVEFRDAKTALFASFLEQGRHVLRYRLRAELPGELRAPPARGEAMYAPDVGGTSASFRFVVTDARPR